MVLVLCWTAGAAVSYWIGRGKGRGTLGAVLGLCFGIVGVVIMLWLRPQPGYGAHDRAAGHTRVGPKPPPPRPVGSSWSPRGQWAPDPYKRHRVRWWSGARWTDRVADTGAAFRDPLGTAPTPEPWPVIGWDSR